MSFMYASTARAEWIIVGNYNTTDALFNPISASRQIFPVPGFGAGAVVEGAVVRALPQRAQ
jgi:hypothetical protein